MNVTERHGITGGSAVEIARSVERALREGRLRAGDRLPTVRGLAGALAVSPTTVAAAYRALRQRGLLIGDGRRGSSIAAAPALRMPVARVQPVHLRDVADGNPAAAGLPDLAPALRELDSGHVLYGTELQDGELMRLARLQLQGDGVPAEHLAVTSGGLDGIERVLLAHLRPGDRVIVEDPGFPSVFDLLGALGLAVLPVPVDDRGLVPRALAAALAARPDALILTPRAQNPFGSALDVHRVRELRQVLRAAPDLLVVEDDHAAGVAGAPALSVCHGRTRFAIVRSVSKSLGPDLRLGIVSGDAETIARLEGRQRMGMRWVSHLLQRIAARLWADPAAVARVRESERVYTGRRDGLLAALAARGIAAHGRSGLNVWIPVAEEASALSALAESGFAALAGERFRLRSAPAIRVTIASLRAEEVERLADALARATAPSRRSETT
jgi:DNA-binding transcriptional MocR family regulator